MRRCAVRSVGAILFIASCAYFSENSSVLDPHWFNGDPDPAFYINPVLDPYLDPGVDPGF